MKNKKHTPGPWALKKGKDSYYGLIGDGKVIIGGFSEHLIDAPGFINAKANAHLIAAAPDMLEALEHLSNELCEGEFVKHSPDAIKKIKYALTKARGE